MIVLCHLSSDVIYQVSSSKKSREGKKKRERKRERKGEREREREIEREKKTYVIYKTGILLGVQLIAVKNEEMKTNAERAKAC